MLIYIGCVSSISCEGLCILLLLLVNSLSGPSVFVFQCSKVLFFKFPAVLISILRSFTELFGAAARAV